MREVFGKALVSAPVHGRQKIEVLPSPEDLKGRVLLKVHPSSVLSCDYLGLILANRRRICMCRRMRNCNHMLSLLTRSPRQHPQKHRQTVKCSLVRPYRPLSVNVLGLCLSL
jgi:hypothetical protein